MRKPVKEYFNPVSSAIETSLKIEISHAASLHMLLSKKRKKGADQTARMRRLVCACVVRKPQKIGFLDIEAHIIAVFMIRAIVSELQPTFFFVFVFKFSSKVHSLLLNSSMFHLFYQAMFG